MEPEIIIGKMQVCIDICQFYIACFLDIALNYANDRLFLLYLGELDPK